MKVDSKCMLLANNTRIVAMIVPNKPYVKAFFAKYYIDFLCEFVMKTINFPDKLVFATILHIICNNSLSMSNLFYSLLT